MLKDDFAGPLYVTLKYLERNVDYQVHVLGVPYNSQRIFPAEYIFEAKL